MSSESTDKALDDAIDILFAARLSATRQGMSAMAARFTAAIHSLDPCDFSKNGCQICERHAQVLAVQSLNQARKNPLLFER